MFNFLKITITLAFITLPTVAAATIISTLTEDSNGNVLFTIEGSGRTTDLTPVITGFHSFQDFGALLETNPRDREQLKFDLLNPIYLFPDVAITSIYFDDDGIFNDDFVLFINNPIPRITDFVFNGQSLVEFNPQNISNNSGNFGFGSLFSGTTVLRRDLLFNTGFELTIGRVDSFDLTTNVSAPKQTAIFLFLGFLLLVLRRKKLSVSTAYTNPKLT